MPIDFSTAFKAVLTMEPKPYVNNLLVASYPAIRIVKHDVERAPARPTAELIDSAVPQQQWTTALFLHATPRSEDTVLLGRRD